MALRIVEQVFSDSGNTIRYGFVPWDSCIFGFPVAEARYFEVGDMEGFDRLVSSFERTLKKSGCSMLCVKVPAGEREIFRRLQIWGYVFIEEMVTPYIDNMQKTWNDYRNRAKKPLARATGDRIEEIKAVAYRSFIYDRFHMDGGFTREKASERYANWVDNSYRTGEDVLYIEEDGAVAGFSIVDRRGDDAWLALLGVDEGRKGRGLGRELLAGTCQYVKDEGIKEFSTSLSLNNIPALNLYSAFGFKFKDPVYVLHKWM